MTPGEHLQEAIDLLDRVSQMMANARFDLEEDRTPSDMMETLSLTAKALAIEATAFDLIARRIQLQARAGHWQPESTASPTQAEPSAWPRLKPLPLFGLWQTCRGKLTNGCPCRRGGSSVKETGFCRIHLAQASTPADLGALVADLAKTLVPEQ